MNIRFILENTIQSNSRLSIRLMSEARLSKDASDIKQVTALWRFNVHISEFLQRDDLDFSTENDKALAEPLTQLLLQIRRSLREVSYGSETNTAFFHLTISLEPLTGPLPFDIDNTTFFHSSNVSTEDFPTELVIDEVAAQHNTRIPRGPR